MEFLYAVADDWCKDYRDLCRRGIYSAASECVKLGVIGGWDRVSLLKHLLLMHGDDSTEIHRLLFFHMCELLSIV